jgi:hypothetical protein
VTDAVRDVTSTLYLECYTCKNETVQVGYTNTHAETETDLAFKHLCGIFSMVLQRVW